MNKPRMHTRRLVRWMSALLGWVLTFCLANVFAAAPSVTVQPVGQIINEGDTLTLSVTAADALGYQWWKDGAMLAGETGSTLSVVGAGITDSGVYTVVVTNTQGTAIGLPADVLVGNPSLMAWGYNTHGQLGIGTTTSTNRPVFAVSNVVTAAEGESHSLFVKADGTLWGMGDNNYGQLGIGTTASTNLPVFVADNVAAVAAGESHSLFVKADGTLWAMGLNARGQLGIGTASATNELPVFVASNVVSVTAGTYHSLFVKTDGTLWGMGDNGCYQLGLGTTVSTNLPVFIAADAAAVAAGERQSLFIKTDGTLWGMGYNTSGQLGLGTVSQFWTPTAITNGVISVAAGERHSLFVTLDGGLWAMGFNLHGQLGDGTTADTNRPVRVADGVRTAAAGGFHSLFVKADGTLWGMGWNAIGELGVGDGVTADALTPVQTLCGLSAVIAKGPNARHGLCVASTVTMLTISTPVGTVLPAAGTYAVSPDSVFTNVMTTPFISDGSTQHVCLGWTLTGGTPASGSGTNAVVTVTDETAVLTWLWRTEYRLDATAGTGGSVDPASVWVEAGATTQLVAAANAGYRLKAWTGDASGAGSPFPVLMDRAKAVSAVFVVPPSITAQPVGQTVAEGGTLTLAVAAADALGYQWWKDGAMLAGETGSTLSVVGAAMKDSGVYTVVLTNADAVTLSVPVDVAVGEPSLLAWGDNYYGQLGCGCLIGTSFPIRVASDAVTAAAGIGHSLFVKADGTLWGMGDNSYGQLGIGTTASTNRPVFVASNVVAVTVGNEHSLFIKTDGTLWGMGLNDRGQLGIGTASATNELPVFVASNAVAVTAGFFHSLFVTADGTLWGMGLNDHYQLGIGTCLATNALPVCIAADVVTAAAGSLHSLFVKADGTLWGMGYSNYGQLGLGETVFSQWPVQIAETVVTVAAGESHSLFVKADGTLWSMGANAFGQLGLGTTTKSDVPAFVADDVVSVGAAFFHSLFTKADGTLWSMGNNRFGQLGINTADVALVTPSRVLCEPGALIAQGSCTLHALAMGKPSAAVAVSTPVGTAEPVAGTYVVSPNTVFTNVMTTPFITGDATQHVCVGWTMVGGTPASGTGTNAVVTVTDEAAVLTWLWRTEYRLTASADANGSVDPASVWVEAGATTQLVATADAGYRLKAWTGDASGAGTPFPVLMDRAKAVSAVFVIPPSITAQPVGQTVAEGGTLSLAVSATAALGYQWWKDGAMLADATNATLTLTGAGMKDSGVYTVALTNADTLTISRPVNVVVGAPSLLAWGGNCYGQLGFGTYQYTNRPIRVSSDIVMTAAAGGYHSLFVKADGTLWGMGGQRLRPARPWLCGGSHQPADLSGQRCCVCGGGRDPFVFH